MTNDIETTAETETYECDECGCELAEDTTSEEFGACWCEACFDKTHRLCTACKDTWHIYNMSEEFPTLCVDCAPAHHQEIIDGLNEELNDIIGGWDGDANEIDKLRRLLSYANA